MKLTSLCSICNKPLVLVNEYQFGQDWYRTYKCGHVVYEKDIPSVPNDTQRNYDACIRGKSAFDPSRHLGCAAGEHPYETPIGRKINFRTTRGKITHHDRVECSQCGTP